MATVSVIMSVFNGAKFLEESINSVLRQTFRDFEFIIVDDGSKDHSQKIIEKASHTDKRIKAFYRTHEGQAPALNFALVQSTGKYIGRIDADDLWHPGKLDTQVRFMNSHPEICLLGTSVKFIDTNGNLKEHKGFNLDREMGPEDVRRSIIRRNLFCHSSVLFRHEVIENTGLYNSAFRISMDYEYWVRILSFCDGLILGEKLTTYRIHPEMISRRFRKDLIRESFAIRKQIPKKFKLPGIKIALVYLDILRMYCDLIFHTQGHSLSSKTVSDGSGIPLRVL